MKEEYQNDKMKIRDELLQQMSEAHAKHEAIEKCLRDELQTLTGSFLTYKVSLWILKENYILNC